MTAQLKSPKRFYDDVSVHETDGGFQILLDTRAIKIPNGEPVAVSTAALAGVIAREWDEQTGSVDLQTMPVTRLAQRACSLDDAERVRLVDEVVKYSTSDLLCYRASEPDSLVLRQTQEWQPLLDWAERALGITLNVTTGLSVVAQPGASLSALRSTVSRLDDFELCGVSPAVALLGSAVLGLALHAEERTAQEVFAASQLDELWQVEQWGDDEEAAERRKGLERDISAIAVFLQSLKGD